MASNESNNNVAFAPLPVGDDESGNSEDPYLEHFQQEHQPTGSQPNATSTTTTTTSQSSPATQSIDRYPAAGPAEQSSSSSSSSRGGPYRDGFSTSVCEGLFADPLDRTACCALTCCATFTQDRNRYIVEGGLPSNLWWKRIGVGAAVIAVLIAVPLFGGDFLLTCIAVLVAIGIATTRQRQALRMRIMREFIFQTAGEINTNQSSLDDCECQSPRKVHRCWACVVKDRLPTTSTNNTPIEETNLYAWGHEQVSFRRQNQGDVCTFIWKSLATCCCGCCGCWWNCWGACATAQEERELRRRLAKERFQIDMITMQGWNEYFPAIQDIRDRSDYSFFSHFGARSKLATMVLWWFAALLALIAFIIVVIGESIRHELPLSRLLIVAATLGQALLVLYVVHWRRHRFDLCLDAVIKLFGVGFCFSTGLAMIIEIVTSTLGNLVLWIVVAIEEATDEPSNMPGPDDPNDSLHNLQTFAKKHIMTFVTFTAFQAFIVAGMSEEFSKYFCFWMVEHPDYPDERDDDGRAAAEKGVHATAAAITCGMVATATGFACAENFLYIFGEGLSVSGEIEVLLLRSCFPVHPICAAIQSIGICRRDVEKDGTQLGQAVLPALLLHGTFDFAIMVSAVLDFTHEDIPDDEEISTLPPMDPDATVKLPSIYDLLMMATITVVGLVYYFYMSNQQKHRLNAMSAAHDSSLALT